MTILDSLVEGALCLGNRRESNELLGMMVRYLVTGEVPNRAPTPSGWPSR